MARTAHALLDDQRVWLIDHGASLYFHHTWGPANPLDGSRDPFAEVREHVLLPWASALDGAAVHLGAALTDELFERVARQLPGSWLDADRSFPNTEAHRAAYVEWLRARARALPDVVEEAERARSLLV